jgi:putative peptidoglycan lipid II flippase
MVGLITLRLPIVNLLFQHGAFGPAATQGTATAVLYYAVGLWAFAGVRVVVPAFYSMQDTRTPVKIGVLAMLANIGLNLILMVPLRHGGLALAASLASALNLILLLWVLRKRIGRIDGRRILISASKVVLASTAIALPSLWLSHLPIWETSGDLMQKIVLLGGGIGVGLLGFILFHSVLKTEEQRFLFDLFKEKLFSKNRGRG